MLIGELLCIAGSLDTISDATDDKSVGYLCHILGDRVRIVARALGDEEDLRCRATDRVTPGDDQARPGSPADGEGARLRRVGQ